MLWQRNSICFLWLVLACSCRPDLRIQQEPVEYQSIDRGEVNSSRVFPIISSSSLTGKIDLTYGFELDQGVVKVDAEKPLSLSLKIKKIDGFNAKLQYGFSIAPDSVTLINHLDNIEIKSDSLDLRSSDQAVLLMIIRDYDSCVNDLSVFSCSLSDTSRRYTVRNEYDRIVKLLISSN